MSQSITFNNAIYIIPDVGESNWGQNLTNYFVAISQGAYQLSGGTAPLTADLSFGSNFGIFSKYFTSITSTPATAGQVRLARADTIDWRNQANGANLPLGVDSSNNLTFNGNIISGSAAGPVTSIAGTANQITASASTGAITLSTPATFIAPGSIAATTTLAGTAATLSATTNQIVLGTTNTVTLSSTAPAASRVYTLPDAGGAAQIVLNAGNYTIGGTWGFSNDITMASSKGIILTDNTVNTVTIKAVNGTTSYTLQLPPDDGTPNQFLQTNGSGTTTWANGGSGTVVSGTTGQFAYYPSSSASVSGSAVLSDDGTTLTTTHPVAITPVTNQLILGATRTVTITAPTPATSSRVVTVPDLSGDYSVVGTIAAQSIGGVKTFTGGAGAITMSGSTIAMGSNKITGLANGTVSTDGAAFGQLPVFTNWATYTPTIVGCGTVSSNTGFWKQMGDHIFVKGYFVVGTSTGVSMTIGLPNSTTINTARISANGYMGMGIIQGSGGSAGFGLTNYVVIFTDGSTNSTMFCAIAAGGAALTKGTGSGLTAANQGFSYYFDYPI